MKLAPHLISTFCAFAAGVLPTGTQAGPQPQSWFQQQGYVPPADTRIIACHGYGCSRRLVLSMDQTSLDHAARLLKAGRSTPEAERRAIREIVKAYTARLSRALGGEPDAPGSPPLMSGKHGQMDCIDETANTTSLLLVLQDKALLAHHQVEHPQSRGIFIDGRYPHVTAVIAEKRTGLEFAIDPWRVAPGQEPDILPLIEWRQDS
jgi:hypothetical protein